MLDEVGLVCWMRLSLIGECVTGSTFGLVRPAANLREHAIIVESFPSDGLFEWPSCCGNRE